MAYSLYVLYINKIASNQAFPTLLRRKGSQSIGYSSVVITKLKSKYAAKTFILNSSINTVIADAVISSMVRQRI